MTVTNNNQKVSPLVTNHSTCVSKWECEIVDHGKNVTKTYFDYHDVPNIIEVIRIATYALPHGH